MSEENPVKITNVTKTKDPRKVEAGKKLAAISKASKKKKADAMQRDESAESADNSSTDLKEIGLMVSVIGILVGVAGLYYRFGPNSKSGCVTETIECEASTSETQKPKTKLDTLD